MDPSAVSQGKNSGDLSWRFAIGMVLLAVAFAYVWILPVFRPRGDYLWGHYRLKDIYLGIPVAIATLCVVIVWAVPARYRRSLALRLTTLATSLLFVLVVFDVVYAFGVMGVWRANYWLDQAHIPRGYSVADDELGFVRKPGVWWRGYVPDVNRLVEYRTDENGFRNSSGQRTKDVVFIGDSFTEAATVEERDTFVQSVARMTGLSTVNLGRGAYGPQQELIVLKRYGLAYKPRVVVWQLFAGNDLDDAEIFAEWMRNPRQVDTTLTERYFNNSLLAGWLTKTRLSEKATPIVTIRYGDGTTSRIGLRYRYEPKKPASSPVGMAETQVAIEAGQRLCQSQGVQLLVVMVPTMVRVLEPHLDFDRLEDRQHYLPDESSEDFSGRIERLCAHAGCSFIDSADALRQAAANDNRNLYIPNDEHLDVRGHAVVAQAVTDWIRAKSVMANSQ